MTRNNKIFTLTALLLGSLLTLGLFRIMGSLLAIKEELKGSTYSQAQLKTSKDCPLGVEFSQLQIPSLSLQIEEASLCLTFTLKKSPLKISVRQILIHHTPDSQSQSRDSNFSQEDLYSILSKILTIQPQIHLAELELGLSQQEKITFLDLESTPEEDHHKISGMVKTRSSREGLLFTFKLAKKKSSIEILHSDMEGRHFDSAFILKKIDQNYHTSAPLSLDHTHLNFSGSITEESIRLSINKIQARGSFGEVLGTGTLETSSSQFDLNLNLTSNHLNEQIIQVLRPALVGKELSEWLHQGITSASCSKAKFDLGVHANSLDKLNLELYCDQALIRPEVHWPKITGEHLNVKLGLNALTIDIDSANMGKTTANNVQVSIPAFSDDPKLNLSFGVDGTILELLQTLNTLPFIEGQIPTQDLTIQGSLKGQSKISIPLNHPTSTTASYHATVANGSLSSKNFSYATIEQINGLLSGSEKQLSLKNVLGDLKLISDNKIESTIRLSTNGSWKFSPHHILFKVSSLFEQTEDSQNKNYITTEILESIHQGNWILQQKSSQPLVLEGTLANKTYISSNIDLSQKDLGFIISEKKNQTPQNKKLIFDIAAAKGAIDFSNAKKIHAKFTHLTIPDFLSSNNPQHDSNHEPSDKLKSKVKSPDFDVRNLPGIDLQIKDFNIGERSFGEVALGTEKTSTGLNIQRISIEQGPCSHYNGKGSWIMKDEKSSQLSLSGSIFCRDMGASLRMIRSSSLLRGFAGGGGYTLTWDSPSSENLDRLKVNGNLKLENGDILMSKSYLLKALELLTVNIRGIDDEGIRANKIEFTFEQSGKMTNIETFEMRTPSYKLNFDGQYDTESKFIDLNASLQLRITAAISRAVLAAIDPLNAKEVLMSESPIDSDEINNLVKYSFRFSKDLKK